MTDHETKVPMVGNDETKESRFIWLDKDKMLNVSLKMVDGSFIITPNKIDSDVFASIINGHISNQMPININIMPSSLMAPTSTKLSIKLKTPTTKPVPSLTVVTHSTVIISKPPYIETYKKGYVILGNTKPYKDLIKSNGGKWNANLTCGGGWIFCKDKLSIMEILVSQWANSSKI